MFTKLGISSVLAGGFVWLFSVISGFMKADNIWVRLRLSTILGEDLSTTISQAVDVPLVQDSLSTILWEIPLGVLIMGLGAVFFIISFFVKDH